MTTGCFADACALIDFFANGAAGMGADARNALQQSVFVSSVTVWELTRKASLGLLPPLPTANGSFAAWLLDHGFLPETLTWGDAEQANLLPNLHKDPMDRLLIAQALRSARPVITSDRLFQAYGVATIW